MKKYEITARGEDCISKTKIIEAKNEKDAFEIAWDLFPEADSVYVSEVKS